MLISPETLLNQLLWNNFMSIINNIVKIPKSNKKLNSEYIKNELKKLGYKDVFRWAIVEVEHDYLKINFCCES